MSVATSMSEALQRVGRPMTLRRLTLGPGGQQVPLDVIVFGRSKNYRPEELVEGIKQGDTEITITNAEIAVAQWPGPPKKGDHIILDGRQTTLTANPEPKYLGEEVLVFVCPVRG